MEDRTTFDLEKNISDWKAKLSRRNLSLDNITELEGHLYEEITELQKIGLSEEECFLVAKKRMGEPEQLATEFEKVHRGIFFANRMTPYLKGILLYVGFLTVVSLLTNISAVMVSKLGINAEYLNALSIGVLLFLTSVLVVLSYKKYRNSHLGLSKVLSIPVLVGVIIVGKLLNYLSIATLTNSIGVSGFGKLQMNLSIYNLTFILLILILSCVVYYSLKRLRISSST